MKSISLLSYLSLVLSTRVYDKQFKRMIFNFFFGSSLMKKYHIKFNNWTSLWNQQQPFFFEIDVDSLKEGRIGLSDLLAESEAKEIVRLDEWSIVTVADDFSGTGDGDESICLGIFLW